MINPLQYDALLIYRLIDPKKSDMKFQKEKKRKERIIFRIVDAFLEKAKQGQSHKTGLRTNFNLALWSSSCVFFYFFFVFIYIYMNNISFASNSMLFYVLLGAILTALLGALYSSKLQSIFSQLTSTGRREKFMKEAKRLDQRNKRR